MGPNKCKTTVDKLHREGKKLCHWDEAKGRHTICNASDRTGNCAGECSNANPSNLGRYALCEGSEICGLDYIFIGDEETDKLEADFS